MRDSPLQRLGLATGVIVLHVAVALGLLSLKTTVRNDAGAERAVVAVRVPFEAPVIPRIPPLDASYWAPPMATPSVIIPDIPALPLAPGENAISVGREGLGDYLGCGMQGDESMRADERARCDDLRKPFYAGPGTLAPPTKEALALERHFDRQKAIQDAPILLPCGGFTDIFCIVATAISGSEFKMGSYAGKPRPENRLAQPIFPYQPR